MRNNYLNHVKNTKTKPMVFHFSLEKLILSQMKSRFLLFNFILMIILLPGSKGYSLDLKSEEIRGKSTTSPVNILQNRYFLKALRPELGLSGGAFVNEAYTDTYFFGYRMSLFINEWLGIELQSLQTDVSDSDDRKALNKLQYQKIGTNEVVSPDPDINAIHGSQDVNFILAPFYGKLNFLDSIIIYSDLYLTAGLSKVDTDQGVISSMNWGAGQRFYWKKSISFRFEFKDRIYVEKRAGEDYTRHAYSVDLGMSYFIL